MSRERQVDAVAFVLERAERLVLARVQALEAHLDEGDPDVWRSYLDAVETLAALTRDRAHHQPDPLMTTKQLAERLGVHERTIRRQRQAGLLTPALASGR